MLREAGFDAWSCPSLPALVESLDEGAAFVVVTEEALATADLHPLSTWLQDQEEWSDLPFILLTRSGGGLERNPSAVRHLEVLGNVTFLERPFHPTTLVSLAKSALRGRRRQYEARGRLAALNESETRYRTLFESIDEGFCVIKFLDGPNGPLSDYVHIEANPAYARHAGIENVVGQRVRDMVPDEAGEWVALYRQVLLTGEPIRFERELVATGRHLELAAFRVEPESRNEVAVLFRDQTARKRAEIALRDLNESLEGRVADAISEREAALAQLHEAQKLETLGQLTGGVAHDFNNLLTPITGVLDFLRRRQDGEDARATRLIDGALQSAERARTLVQRLLGFARRQALQTGPIDSSELIEGMRDLIMSSIGSKIELRLRCEPGLPMAVADPNQLELAILNLCVNARDAMPDGGVLTLSVEAVSLGPNDGPKLAPGLYVRVSVIDTGCGMDAVTLARAIEPFYSTKDVGRGTGLGLSMVHGLAGQLGGAFTLSSSPGEGTRADLWLRSAARAGASFRPLAGATEPLRSSRTLSILLVDDEELVREATAEMLRDLGHDVVTAGGGEEALAKLAAGLEPELIVTDYMMPRMDGAQFAARVRGRQPDLPLLLITGYAGGDEITPDLRRLAKPFRQADLAIAIAQAIEPRSNVVMLKRP
jgi:PAS domain S-box-containing protein